MDENIADYASYAANHPAGTKVSGRVRAVRPFGVFVELAPNVQALLEVLSFAGNGHPRYPDDYPAVGTVVEAEIMGIHGTNIRLTQRPHRTAPLAQAETLIPDELRDDPTVVLWRGMLMDVGGMSAADFAQYVARWRDEILFDKSGWFYHDTAGYYAAPKLIPAKLFEIYRHGDLIPLENEIHSVLNRYFHQEQFDRSRAPEVRAAIDQAVAKWTAENPPVQ